MVESGSVIVELTEREVFLTSALMLLWRVIVIGDMLPYLASINDPVIKEMVDGLVISDLDGSFNKMLVKYRNAAVAGIDGTKNL